MDSQTVSSHIAEIKNIPTKQDLEEKLKSLTYVITFKKIDGDERKMTCTKQTRLIPLENLPKNEHKTHEKTITVWDINAVGWRSFRYDKIISIALFDDK